MFYTFMLFGCWILLLAVIKLLALLVHEMGHALTLLALQEDKVTVYLGSMGDPSKSLKIHCGRMVIYVKYNPFTWGSGLCVPHGRLLSVKRQMAYIVMGPLASLLLVIAGGLAVKYAPVYPMIKLVFFFIAFIALTDFILTGIPRPSAVMVFGGGSTLNDASAFWQLVLYQKYKPHYEFALEKYKQKDYAAAVICFERFFISWPAR